jgi:hypothetical protein
MLAASSSVLASAARRRVVATSVRSLSTQVEKGAKHVPGGPIGDDGRHELWREGIYDHDNEPK